MPVLKGDATPGIVTLVGKGGGQVGGGGHGRCDAWWRRRWTRDARWRRGRYKGAYRGGGGGGYKGAYRGGGGGGYKGAYRGGDGSRHVYAGGGGGKYYGKSGGKHYGDGDRKHYGGGDRKHYAYKDGDKRHAYNDRDHDHDKFHNRHRVFRNGVWVWVYGPGYTAYGDDCYWLRRQAIITGSPYWWDRYYACVGYDYY